MFRKMRAADSRRAIAFVEPAEISRGETLDVLFKLHPEHAHRRADVSKDFDQQELFSFSKERWGETTTNLLRQRQVAQHAGKQLIRYGGFRDTSKVPSSDALPAIVNRSYRE